MHELKMARGRFYGVMIDYEDAIPEGAGIGEHVWGVECFEDGTCGDKPMDEIIVTAANHACDPAHGEYPGGLKPGGYIFSYDDPARAVFEEPRRPKDDA